jgi:hypothetical protein
MVLAILLSVVAFTGISTFTFVSLRSFSGPGLLEESSDRSEITSFRDMLREQRKDEEGAGK